MEIIYSYIALGIVVFYLAVALIAAHISPKDATKDDIKNEEIPVEEIKPFVGESKCVIIGVKGSALLSNLTYLSDAWSKLPTELANKLKQLGEDVESSSSLSHPKISLNGYLVRSEMSKRCLDNAMEMMVSSLKLPTSTLTTIHHEDPTTFSNTDDFILYQTEAAIICDSDTEIDRVLKYLTQRKDTRLRLLGVQNRFANPRIDGYRDLVLYLDVKSPDNKFDVCKVYIHLRCFKDAADGLNLQEIYNFFGDFLRREADDSIAQLRLDFLSKFNQALTSAGGGTIAEAALADFIHSTVYDLMPGDPDEDNEASPTEATTPSELMDDQLTSILLLLEKAENFDLALEVILLLGKRYEKLFGAGHIQTLSTMTKAGMIFARDERYEQSKDILQVAVAGLKVIDPNMDHPASLFAHSTLVEVLRSLKMYYQAEEAQELVILMSKKTYGESHPSTLAAHDLHGQLLCKMASHVHALKAYEIALAGREKVLGAVHPDTLTTINHMGVVYSHMKEFELSHEMYQRALAGREFIHGKDHPETLGSVNNIGTLYHETHRYLEARAWYERALQGKEAALGMDDKSTIGTAVNLCEVLVKIDDKLAAVQLYKRIFDYYVKVHGPTDKMTLHYGHKLGSLYRETGSLAEAALMYERLLTVWEELKGPTHKNTVRVLNQYADILLDATEINASETSIQKARVVYERALATREAHLGPDHKQTIASVFNLGVLLGKLSEWQQAKALLERALRSREKSHGITHNQTLDIVNHMIRTLHKSGDAAGALQLCSRALKASQEMLGLEHPDSLALSNNMGNLLHSMGDLEGAREAYEYAERGLTILVGDDHANTLGTRHNLAIIAGDQGRFEESSELFSTVLATRERVLGAAHLDTLNTVFHFGVMRVKSKDFVGAAAMLDRATAGFVTLLGTAHGTTRAVCACYASLLVRLGHHDKADEICDQYFIGDKALQRAKAVSVTSLTRSTSVKGRVDLT